MPAVPALAGQLAEVDSRLCSGIHTHMYMRTHKCVTQAHAHTHTHTYIQTQNKLASWLVMPADCFSDTIFSLVSVTAVIILTHMHEEIRLSQRSFFYCGHFSHKGGVASIENVLLFGHHAKGHMGLKKTDPSLDPVCSCSVSCPNIWPHPHLSVSEWKHFPYLVCTLNC